SHAWTQVHFRREAVAGLVRVPPGRSLTTSATQSSGTRESSDRSLTTSATPLRGSESAPAQPEALPLPPGGLPSGPVRPRRPFIPAGGGRTGPGGLFF